jgi:hypothetical protein
MMLACGTSSLMLPVGLLSLMVLASFPVGLAAMTSVLSRPGHNSGAVRRISSVNILTGICLLPIGLVAWPAAALGLALLTIGAVTKAANRPAVPGAVA